MEESDQQNDIPIDQSNVNNEDIYASISQLPQLTGAQYEEGGLYYVKPLPPLESHALYIYDPKLIESTIKNHIEYSMGGQDLGDPVTRRYSDFYSLREKLVERWPGVYIPNIPGKKVIKNTETKTINMRMRLINRFLDKLSKIKYLYNSEETQLIKANTSDCAKNIEKLKKLSYLEKLERYQSAFPDYYENYDVILGKGKVNDFLQFAKATQTNLNNFSKAIQNALVKRELEKLKYIELLSSIQEYEKYNIMEYADNDDNKLVFFNPNNANLTDKILKVKEKIFNSFASLKEWVEGEILDVNALLEALNGINNLNIALEKLTNKITSIENDIKKMQYNQKNLNFLKTFFKKKEDIISDLEKDKIKCEEDVTNLSALIKIVTFNMEGFIETYKAEKVDDYYRNLKLFIIYQKENNRVMQELWSEVKTILNSNKNINNLEENFNK
jgi:hypothetical protein